MRRGAPADVWTVPLVLTLGIASGWLSGSGDAWFQALRKPWFLPPGWVFPVVWTILYAAMGVALARLIEARGAGRGAAIGLFAAQLALNLAWSPTFFGAHRIGAGLAIIVALDVAVVATIVAAARVRRAAAALLLPYAGWLALATALNDAVWRLNP